MNDERQKKSKKKAKKKINKRKNEKKTKKSPARRLVACATTMAKSNAITLVFKEERDTKNTIRFQEQVNDDLDSQKIGTVYVAKSALKEMGWKRGQNLCVTIKAE